MLCNGYDRGEMATDLTVEARDLLQEVRYETHYAKVITRCCRRQRDVEEESYESFFG